MPHLHSAFNSRCSGTRKAVVYCLVAAYRGVGDALFPRLEAQGLSAAQRKLVTLYVHKDRST
eukprot:CAMPEP_0194733762 /NCGR_PEP_ID=MMETSP0296-20130528/66732_1 /TAXON_ID=39354 /ORGANISM="Heterosigma akashiwo, Strain CCMP2393" /LENGTH=61 /DNA_ID=CAMNT_0039642239 /DNA_START=187 /DNA_END=368 /DNA_ORIENTATION=+